MKYPTRIYYTEADKALMWDRWREGESLKNYFLSPDVPPLAANSGRSLYNRECLL